MTWRVIYTHPTSTTTGGICVYPSRHGAPGTHATIQQPLQSVETQRQDIHHRAR